MCLIAVVAAVVNINYPCLAEGHNEVSPVSFEPATIRPRVNESATEPPRSSLQMHCLVCMHRLVCTRSHAAFLMTKIMTLVPCDNIYSMTSVKHHPNIISETFFVYKFLQKNNQFVIFCYPSLPLVCYTYQNAIWPFC